MANLNRLMGSCDNYVLGGCF